MREIAFPGVFFSPLSLHGNIDVKDSNTASEFWPTWLSRYITCNSPEGSSLNLASSANAVILLWHFAKSSKLLLNWILLIYDFSWTHISVLLIIKYFTDSGENINKSI